MNETEFQKILNEIYKIEPSIQLAVQTTLSPASASLPSVDVKKRATSFGSTATFRKKV